MQEQFINKITQVFEKNNISLLPEQKQQFYKYYSLLIEWNEKFNLTAITEMEDVIVKHFLDSVIGSSFIKENSTIIDVGAGAGFPSLPLKIVRPDLKILLVDSVNKKITFLQEVIKKLNLNNVQAIHGRVEDVAKKEQRENFDYCVARAVASLNTLSEYCLPFVRVGGTMLAYKSSDIEEEINLSKKAINTLGGKIEKVETVIVEGVERKFVKIKKVLSTPNKYPRSGNKPRLMPL